jgi:single-stranded-DNA-specific exonuclease
LDDEIEARTIAGKLEAMNAKRKAVEEDMLAEALALGEGMLASEPSLPLLFLAQEGWHKGLLGLVAGRVAERFRLPTFIAAPEPDGCATGSARSIAGVDLGALIRMAVHAGLLLKGGGHAMAAGFKLECAKQQAVVDFFCTHLADRVAEASSVRNLPIDGALSAGGATLDLMAALDRAGPYGTAHPEPRFVFPAHRLSRVRAIKEQHVRCTLRAPGGARLEACAFRIADTPLGKLLLKGEGLPLHVAGHLRRTSWQGRESVELLIEDAADPRGV